MLTFQNTFLVTFSTHKQNVKDNTAKLFHPSYVTFFKHH